MAPLRAGNAACIVMLLAAACFSNGVMAAKKSPGAYDKAKASAEEYFSPPSATDSLKTGAADAYAKAKDLASDASQAAYDATREPTTFEKAKGYLSPPSTADKAKAQASDAYAAAQDLASQGYASASKAASQASEAYTEATRQPTYLEKIRGYFSPPSTAQRVQAAAATAYAATKEHGGRAVDSASKAAYDATREPTAYEKAKGYLSPPSTADKVKAGAADAYAYAKDSASDAYDAASQAAHDATREPTLYEKAKGKLSPPSTADKVKAGAADAYAQAKGKASDAYDAAAQTAHDATQEPTMYEKAKGKLSPPSTADKVAAGAADAYANVKGKASGAYDSAAQAAHDATREPTTFEKAKGYLSPPSAADKAKGHANQAYNTAKGKASQAYNSAAQGVHEATREPTTFEKAKGYFTPSTTDKVKGHANQAYADAKGKASDAYDSAAQTAHDATREPTTFEKAKGYLSPPSAADKAKGHANQAYNTAKGKASDAYDSAAQTAHDATREPTAYEKAQGYLSPPSTADNLRAGAEDTAAGAAARFQAVKDSIAAVGQPSQKSYFQQAKDYFKKSPSQQAQDYASDTYNSASKQAQGAYDSASGAASDASSRVGDAANRAKRSAKHNQKAAAGQAGEAYDSAAKQGSDAYNYAADTANQAAGKAGEYASKGRQAAGQTYDQAAGQASSTTESMRAALSSYSDWLQNIGSDVKDSSSRSAQDAAAYGKESAGSAKQYSDSTYQQAKKALADKLGQGRKTSDALYERTQGNSQELWSALQEQFKASSPADRKALDVEWKRAQKGHTDFGSWLTSGRKSLSDSYDAATQSAEDSWAALKRAAGNAADYIGDKAEL